MKAEAFYTDTAKMTTYLVCELCAYPQLGVYLRNRYNKIILESQATAIITCLLETLQYLHKNRISHRDIKPENILYNPLTKHIKVIDFDCAKSKREYEQKFQMWTKTGSIHYQAPQYFQGLVYSQKVDLWAVGVIAYELIAGCLPYKSHHYHRMIKMITEEQIDVDKLSVSQGYKFLLKKLLDRNAQKRYSAAQCLRLPVILKSGQIHSLRTLDDFHVQLASPVFESPKSCTDIASQRNSQMCAYRKKLDSKPIVKYFCFVTQLQKLLSSQQQI